MQTTQVLRLAVVLNRIFFPFSAHLIPLNTCINSPGMDCGEREVWILALAFRAVDFPHSLAEVSRHFRVRLNDWEDVVNRAFDDVAFLWLHEQLEIVTDAVFC